MKIIDKKNMIKSIIYRIYSFIVTFIVSFLLTGNIKLSIMLGFVENLVKILTYYWFDLVWYRFSKNKYKKTILWFTGLSGSGKTTIAKEVLDQLQKEGYSAMILDGDEIRDIFKNYGFDKESRLKHINDVAKMAVYLQSQGIIPIVSLISPYAESRDNARKLTQDFTEIYIDTPLEVCEKRDVKGLYKKARAGEIKDFTGIHDTAPYEIPKNAELNLSTENVSVEYCAKKILNYIKK